MHAGNMFLYKNTRHWQCQNVLLLFQVPALVARYAGQPSLSEAVHVAVRAQQNSDGAVMWAMTAARILERVVLVSGGLGMDKERCTVWIAG